MAGKLQIAMAYRCNLCVHFVALTLALFLNHLVRYHTSDPNFHVLCGINGCSKTYRNCISFKNHIKRKHADLLLAEKNGEAAEQENDTNDVNGDSSASEMDEDSGETYDSTSLPQFDFHREAEEIRRAGALYVLKMKHKDRASQTAVNSFIENTTGIVRTSIDILKAGLMNRLDTAGIDFNAVPGLPELFKEDSLARNPFSGLLNEHQQNNYFKDHFNLVVS